jgi:murein DD-endopeptidase MepM/ murein hydrolase activator NlpD
VILAPADGIVSYVGRKQYYGITVYIDHHGNGYTTRYAHLVQSAVGEGDVVRRGDIVGYMGNTGRSTGPHLHYEVRVMGKPVDPLSVIVPTDVVVD